MRAWFIGALLLGNIWGCKSADPAYVTADATPDWASPWDKQGADGKCRNHPLTKLQDQGSQKPKLSAAEMNALKSYQGDGYGAINALLRGQPFKASLRAKAIKEARLVQGVIERQKAIPERFSVYRSYHTSRSAPEVGKRFAAEGFVSTSLAREYGNGKILFGIDDDEIPQDGMLAITVLIPEQMRGFSMNALWDSLRLDECEVLLAHGSTYRVIASETKPAKRKGTTFNLTAQVWQMETDVGPLPDALAAGASLTGDDEPLDENAPLPDESVLQEEAREVPETPNESLDAFEEFGAAFVEL